LNSNYIVALALKTLVTIPKTVNTYLLHDCTALTSKSYFERVSVC